MKKIYTLILTLILSFSLTGCSKADKDIALDFFDAFNTTLNADSGTFIGEISSQSNVESKFFFEIFVSQKNDINLTANIDLEADGNREDDFINFFIRDGKTYLNAMGVKSQSLAANIGIEKDEKLNVFNPFLSYSNDELIKMFERTEKKDNKYIMELNKHSIEVLFDAMGSISLNEARIEAIEKDGHFTSLDMKISGIQKINDEKANIHLNIHIEIKDFNTLSEVPFPSDLESY